MSSSTPYPPSLWWSSPPPAFPPLEGSFETDVLVIGGGITGVLLAYTLLDHGATVTVVDSGSIAGEASGRNAGFLLAAPAEPYAEQVEMWGRAGAHAVLEIGRRSHARIRELVETLGIDCDYRSAGSVRLARTELEAEDLRASLPLLKADGYPMEEIAVAGAVPPHAVPRFVAAFLTREDGEIHPVKFLHAVARAAAMRGARVHAHTPLVSASWRGRAWEAELPGGRVEARALVLATNAYAPILCPGLQDLIRPRRGQMLATAPIPELLVPRPSYAHWGYQYWRQTADGRIVIGGWRDLDLDREVGFDAITTTEIQTAIEAGLAELVPGGVAIEHRWAGIMGFARDGRPLVGWLDADHHLAIAAGYTGHGMGMAAACVQDLAEILSWKHAPGIASFDPQRFRELQQRGEGFTALGAAAADAAPSADPT